MKRVTVFVLKKPDGKTFLIPENLSALLERISLKFNINAKRIFTKTGGEIDSIDLIFDNDILYVTEGESFNEPVSSWITLNVGGKLFTTSRSTLTDREPNSMLARMFCATQNGEFLYQPSQLDQNNAYLIDRSPTYFEPILNYLRNGQIIVDSNLNLNGILTEAKYYGIESMIPELQARIQQNGLSETASLNRNDVIRALITTPITSNLRFQGVNLQGANLSKLDLRFINFKYANLAKCNLNLANLSWCCLERADLSFTNLQNAQLLGVKSLCANFEGAHLQGCNFEDPGGVPANLEGCNLKGANLEGSNMTCVNLRVATLKNANLKNCDLRAAVLAGADLECCDLSGSDLQEANLRGANLKNAAFELMLTPLHMSQTIR